MQENSTFSENSDAAAAAAAAAAGVDGSISNSGVFGEEERSRESNEDGGGGGDRNNNSAAGNNRWPREETLALLKVRSDMDIAFKDSGIKAPLWEEVSRKLAELGYHRSAKKCKEKFENIYKYHRRTKDGRSSRTNSKSYRFFEQLEAFDHNHNPSSSPLPPPPPPVAPEKKINQNPNMTPTPTPTPPPPLPPVTANVVPPPLQDIITNSITSSSGEELEGTPRGTKRKRKRKMSDFFERLMKEVMEKQENLQKNFIEAIERYERERIAREEAWKIQENARMKRDHELLVQERSIAAAKDAAVISFLQKFSEQAGTAGFQLPENFSTPREKKMNSADERQENSYNNGGGGESYTHTQMAMTSSASSSRWPKTEVEALIKIRTTFFDEQNQEIINGTKGPLWEEISSAMKKIGYDRSAKRCKEKWENINKYFKRVRESNKRRPEDSKTCPYFPQLEALYKVKSSSALKKVVDNNNNSLSNNNSDTSGGYNFKPEDLLMQMMGHNSEQQQQIINQLSIGEENGDVDDEDEEEDDDDNDNDGGGEDDDDDGDDDERENYQIVVNNDNTSSMTIME